MHSASSVNPILLDIPVPIRTPRLVIRPLQSSEGPRLAEAITESLADLAPWLPWATKAPKPEESEERIRRGQAAWILREDLWMSIFDATSGQLLGGTGLHRPRWDVPGFEIGYWLRSSAVGKGIVTESTNALTRFAFRALRAKRVELRCDPLNVRSVAVIERLGFAREGHLRGEIAHPGPDGVRIRDTLIYARHDMAGLPALDVKWG